MNKRGLLLVFILFLETLVFALAGVKEAQAAPYFQAAGTAVDGTGAVSPVWPAHAAGDIALLFVESAGGESATLSTPAGFASVTNSPQFTGAGTAGTRLTVFWARAISSSMAAPTVADPGDHVIAQILTYRGVIATGDPWDVTGGGVKGAASTSLTATGVTATVPDTLIVVAATQDVDSNSTTFSGWANSNLTSITERTDYASNTGGGNGGGFGVIDGAMATAGATGNTTASISASTTNAFLTIALKPPIAGAPTKLAFLQQPSNTVFNATINPPVTVEIQDASGNLVTTATNAVTIAIGTNPASGTLSGTLTVPALAGVATFNNLSIDNVGNGYTLTASAAGLTGATSDAFNITTGGFGLTECAASRYGSDLGCTAGDVSITGMRVVGDTTSCIGGSSITLDLELSINFATPDRWDVGVFISNDGNEPKLLPASGGATTCSVSILPPSSPFLDLDPGPWGGITDICGDGNKNIGSNTCTGTCSSGICSGTGTCQGNGIHYMPNVTVNCQALGGSVGNLYIPFVVSWDNQSSPSGATCTSIANPVPNTPSKCNAPEIAQGTVSVVVLPTITKTEPLTFVSSGTSVTYTVVITNTTGDTLTNAVFKDPAVTGITVSGVSCSGVSCPAPASVTVGAMQGAGITIPTMPAGSSVTFTINAILTGNPPDTRTNTATVTVGGQTNSASDTDTIVRTIAIDPSTLSKLGTPSTWVVYNYTLYNFSGSSDTISLSAISNHGWPVLIRNAADTATISSLTVPASGCPKTVQACGCTDFIIKVQIPADAASDTFDVTIITATSGNDPSKTATATANTTVVSASSSLTLTPNNTGSGGKGSSAYYDHRVQNNTASSQTVTFSTSFSGPSCTGWTVTPPVTATLAAFGGYADVVVKVNIPSGANTGDVCTATTTASAGGYNASATDETTVMDIALYSDGGYTDERYIFPAGNDVYARAYGAALATTYKFCWYDSSNTLQRTSPLYTGPGTLSDTYPTLPNTPFGTWRVEVRQKTVAQLCDGTGTIFAQTNFYVGPDHLKASYTGPKPSLGANVIIPITLHDRYNHVVPMASGSVVQGNPPTTKDPLKVTITVSGSATIVTTTLIDAVISGQTVTGRLNPATGTASVTITDTVKETVIITPFSYNSALYGSPSRDESASVTFIWKRARIIDWREVLQ